MNDCYIGEMTRKAQPMVDFTYNKNSRRQSRFQLFTPKSAAKKGSINKPKDIFNANNNINSILSKNLMTIINENKNEKNENSKTISLYQNVNCLLKKNKDSNKYLFSQMVQKRLSRFYPKETILSNNIKSIYENEFQDDDIIISKQQMNEAKKISHTMIKNKNNELRKQLEILTPKNKNKKVEFNITSINNGCKTTKNRNIRLNKRKSAMINKNNNNSKFGLKKKKTNTDAPIEHNHEFKNLMKNIDLKKRHNSGFIQPNLNFNFHVINPNENSSTLKEEEKEKEKEKNNLNINTNINKKRNSLKMALNNNNYKINSNLSEKAKAPRHSFFAEIPKNNIKMQIPSLRQINKNLAKSFIANKMLTIKKELAEHENNEILEIINNLPKNKNDKKKNKRKSLKPNIGLNNFNNSEQNELIKKELSQLDDKPTEDDRYQKKYRKLFLNKNLYDSLDDEEAMEEERQYIFYISTNSITVYILDTVILISSLISLFYLPLYISLHFSSYTIYHNLFSSMLFYFIDLIYIIDLLTGFFRSYYNFEEILIRRKRDMFLHYLTGWFIFDFIEALPIFTLLTQKMNKFRLEIISSNKNVTNMFHFGLDNKLYAITFLKSFKIFKSITNNRAANFINKFLDNYEFYSQWKGLFYTILITLSTLHFSSCFFIFLGKNEFNGWILYNNLHEKKFIEKYVAALHFQITTLTTVGYGDITTVNFFERYYGIMILIIGTCAYSWIVTYISNYIKKNNEKYIDYEKNMNVLNEIKIEYPNLNQYLYDRITRYLNYKKSENKYNLKFILESLPSSLQNNLIIEIYKPIIENFQFFKSFENSDFFVKIVTSLKPILSMREDILIQEGDIIEDIIFIKKGVLTLEIVINLNNPKKSIESHLKMIGMDCFKNISNNKFSAIMNMSSMNDSHYNSDFDRQIYHHNCKNGKEIKIIDLRKNEHFGDILMILNEKSPLTVKVKSKKAELFFLEKTEATEISNRYSNIWKRIVNRSLHNMKQIKNLIRKKVLFFAENNNIKIDKKLKERYLTKQEKVKEVRHHSYTNKLNTKNKKHSIETIIEEDDDEDDIIKSQTALSDKNIITESTKIQRQNIQTQTGIISGNKNPGITKNYISNKKLKDYNNNLKLDNITNITTEVKVKKSVSSKKKQNLKEELNKLEINNNIKDVNDMITTIDKEVIQTNKNQINNININIYTPKIQFPLNQMNLEKIENINNNNKKDEIDNSTYLGKVNSEISYNADLNIDIKNNDIIMNNFDENSNIFYSNIKSIQNKENNDSNINNEKIEKIINNKIKNDKAEIKTNDNVSNKCMKILSSYKLQEIKSNKFNSLNLSQSSTSFTLNSSYENINEISKNNYLNNSYLREKTKKFILDQINNIKDESPTSPISPSRKALKKKPSAKILSVTSTIKQGIGKFFRKKSTDFTNRKKLNKSISINMKPISKRVSCLDNEPKIKTRVKSSKSIMISEDEDDDDINKNIDMTNFSLDKSLSVIGRKKTAKVNKNIKKIISVEETENTFYSKISRMKSQKRKINSPSRTKHHNSMISYDKLISKNIEKNQQNLNNPEEYFEGFFNHIILNQQKDSNIVNDDSIKKRKLYNKDLKNDDI